MKRLLLTMIIVTVFGASAIHQASGETPAVKWRGFNEGYKLALAQKKPAIIDFYASWCHWCKVMDRETFQNREIAGLLAKEFITIRIDTEGSDVISFHGKKFSPKDFSMYAGVQGLPTLLFMDRNGEIITRIPGFIRPNVFLPLLSYMRDECYRDKVSFKDYIDGKKSGCKKGK